MRLITFLFCCLFLSSCTHHTTEVWSWNPGKGTFEHTLPPDKGDEKRVEERGFAKGITEKTLESDLDGDGVNEIFELKDYRIMAREGETPFWQSPEEWRVTDIILADSTNDGVIDINIAAWRNANYGPSKPFWEGENDMTPRHHFFVMKMEENRITPIWQSSNLEDINQEVAIADVDGDSKNELIVIERRYDEKLDCHDTALAVWRWSEWGFYNVWRSERGNYCGLEIRNGKIEVMDFDK